jgi:hypothetical protein
LEHPCEKEPNLNEWASKFMPKLTIHDKLFVQTPNPSKDGPGQLLADDQVKVKHSTLSRQVGAIPFSKFVKCEYNIGHVYGCELEDMGFTL